MRQYSEVLNACNSTTHNDSENGRKPSVCLRLFLANTFYEMLTYTQGNLLPSWFTSISNYFPNKAPRPPHAPTSTLLDVLLVVCPY